MKYVRLGLGALAAMLSAWMLLGRTEQGTIFAAAYVAAACLLGEYLLPFLSHLSDELFDLHRRVESGISTLNRPPHGAAPSRLRIYVLDEDAPVITWVGFRTVLVSRGCYNLQAGEFRCVLQEAFEQRRSLRSFILLAATVGNFLFLGCRLFCRFGRFVCRLIGMLVGAVIHFRHPLRAGRTGAVAGDTLYCALSSLFLLVGNLSAYVPYWVLLVWSDLDDDRVLCGYGLKGALRRVLDEIRHTRYTGRFLREWALIMRPPVQWRLSRIDRASEQPRPARRAPDVVSAPVSPARSSRSAQPHSGLIVPDALRQASGDPQQFSGRAQEDTSVASDEQAPKMKIKVCRVTRREAR